MRLIRAATIDNFEKFVHFFLINPYFMYNILYEIIMNRILKMDLKT